MEFHWSTWDPYSELLFFQLESIEHPAVPEEDLTETQKEDFEYIKVLGKGSFGKVSHSSFSYTHHLVDFCGFARNLEGLEDIPKKKVDTI